MKYKVAVAQMDSGEDTEENQIKMETYIRKAAGDGADLIIFPEHAEYLGMDYENNASPVPGEITSFYAFCAERYGLYVHCGTLTEKREGGKPYKYPVFSERENGELLPQTPYV